MATPGDARTFDAITLEEIGGGARAQEQGSLQAAIQASQASLPDTYRASQPTPAQQAILPEGQVWYDPPREGNCFYHALATALGRPDDHAEIRQQTANYASHPETEGKSLESLRSERNPDAAGNEMIDAIATPSQYTGLAEYGPINAARAFNVAIMIIEDDGQITALNYDPNGPNPAEAPDVVMARAWPLLPDEITRSTLSTGRPNMGNKTTVAAFARVDAAVVLTFVRYLKQTLIPTFGTTAASRIFRRHDLCGEGSNCLW